MLLVESGDSAAPESGDAVLLNDDADDTDTDSPNVADSDDTDDANKIE